MEVIEEADEDKGKIAADDDKDLDPEPKEKDTSRTQKRIDKLTAQRRESERREAAANVQLNHLTNEMNTLKQGQGRQTADEFQNKYNQIKKDLYTAAEEGDTQRQVDLTEQMADMRATARISAEQKRTQENYVLQQQNNQQQQAVPPQEAQNWWTRNNWFNGAGHAAESAYAKEVDYALEDEGFDKEEPEYYEELDKRLQSRFPELYSNDDKPKAKPKARPATAPTGGQRQGGGAPKDGRIRLTRDELRVAQELGLTTEVQLRDYAKEIERLA